MALPGHERVHRHQFQRRVTADPDLRPHGEDALLAAEPCHQDRRRALLPGCFRGAVEALRYLVAPWRGPGYAAPFRLA